MTDDEHPILKLEFAAPTEEQMRADYMAHRQGLEHVELYANAELYVAGWYDGGAYFEAAVALSVEARLRLIHALCQTLLP